MLKQNNFRSLDDYKYRICIHQADVLKSNMKKCSIVMLLVIQWYQILVL